MCIKIIELIGTSSKSFEGAVQDAITTASKTIRGITGVDVLGQTAEVAKNKVVEYRVNVKLAFKVQR